MSRIFVYVDGRCEPVNPGGIASYGFVVKDSSGELLKESHGVVGTGGKMTNNVAEYTSAIEALKWVGSNISPDSIVLRGDSQLLVRQLTGEYQVKSPRIRPLYNELVKIVDGLNSKFKVEWIPREENEEADALSKQAVSKYIRTHEYEYHGYPVIECDECGAWMIAREGKYGMFYGCSRYPKCRNTRPLGGGKE